MGFFKRNVNKDQGDSDAIETAPENSESALSHASSKGDLGKNFTLTSSRARGAHSVQQRPATFNTETGELTIFATYKDGSTQTLRYDLLSDPIRVRGFDGEYDPHLSIQNENYKTSESNFFNLDISSADLVDKPLFAAALRDVILRNQFRHAAKSIIETNLETWDLKSTNRYRALIQLYLLDIADALFDGVDLNTLRKHTTTVDDYRTVTTEQVIGETTTWSVTSQQERVIEIAGERLTVDTSVSLGDDVAHATVKGPGFNCSYQLPLLGDGDLLDVMLAGLRPGREPGRGMNIVNHALEKDHGLGVFPASDRHFVQALAQFAVEEWVPFYKIAKEMTSKYTSTK